MASQMDVLDAIARGDIDALRSAPALNPRARLENGDTMLIWACRTDQPAVAQWLIERGAKVNGTNREATALYIASHENSVELANVNRAADNGVSSP